MNKLIEHFINEELGVIFNDKVKQNNELYEEVLDKLNDIISTIKIPRNEFLNEIINVLNNNTNNKWQVKRKIKQYYGSEEVTPPSIYAEIFYKETHGTKTSYYLVSDDKIMLYAEKNNGEYHPNKAVNNEIYNYATIEGLNLKFDKLLKEAYEKVFYDYLKKNKSKILKKLYTDLNSYYKELFKKRNTNIKVICEASRITDLYDNYINKLLSDHDFALYDSWLNSSEYQKYQELPRYDDVTALIHEYEYLGAVNDDILRLDEDSRGNKKGWEVLIKWNVLDTYSENEVAYTKAPKELMKLMHLYDYFRNLKLKYKLNGQEIVYDKNDYSYKFESEEFIKEPCLNLEFYAYDKYLTPSKLVIEKINEISKLINELEVMEIYPPTMAEVFDLIKFDKDADYCYIEGFRLQGEVMEDSDYRRNLIQNYCNEIKERNRVLIKIIKALEENRRRVLNLNRRAEFYDDLYTKYARKIKTIDKRNRVKEIHDNAIERERYLYILNNLICDIKNSNLIYEDKDTKKNNKKKKSREVLK